MMGISLTVAYVDAHCFKVSIIPHTQQVTALHDRKVGDIVNLECDIIGKYVEKLMRPAASGRRAGNKKRKWNNRTLFKKIWIFKFTRHIHSDHESRLHEELSKCIVRNGACEPYRKFFGG